MLPYKRVLLLAGIVAILVGQTHSQPGLTFTLFSRPTTARTTTEESLSQSLLPSSDPLLSTTVATTVAPTTVPTTTTRTTILRTTVPTTAPPTTPITTSFTTTSLSSPRRTRQVTSIGTDGTIFTTTVEDPIDNLKPETVATFAGIGGGVLLIAILGIYIFRKWKLRPSRQFRQRMDPNYTEGDEKYGAGPAPIHSFANLGSQASGSLDRDGRSDWMELKDQPAKPPYNEYQPGPGSVAPGSVGPGSVAGDFVPYSYAPSAGYAPSVGYAPSTGYVEPYNAQQQYTTMGSQASSGQTAYATPQQQYYQPQQYGGGGFQPYR